MSKKIAVLSAQERQNTFGTFTYGELGGGRIEINPQWVAQNLTQCHLPKANGKGEEKVTLCHHLVKKPLELAFTEIAERGLWRLIHSFDGLWVPRHMTWNPKRPLSSHSWGIAFDLNAATNPYGGTISDETRAINEVFNRYGFAWGGDWQGAKDAMHWELAQVNAWKQQKSSASPRLIVAVERNGNFSYHACSSATWQDDHFMVQTREMAQIMDALPLTKNTPTTQAVPLNDALGSLGAQIVKVGDYRSDPYDPRYYVFAKLSHPTHLTKEVVVP